MTDTIMTDALAESSHLRTILQDKEADLIKMRILAKKLLSNYVGVLTHTGATVAANRHTNSLVCEAEDILGVLK